MQHGKIIKRKKLKDKKFPPCYYLHGNKADLFFYTQHLSKHNSSTNSGSIKNQNLRYIPLISKLWIQKIKHTKISIHKFKFSKLVRT